MAAHADEGAATPEYEFGWRYATGWLSALKRLAPPATRTAGVLVLDASSPLELDALYAQSLELMLRRAGIRTLSLSTAITPTRLVRALPALDPSAVVLAGRSISLDALGRLVYSVRSVAHQAAIFDYRGAVPDTGASTVRRLGQTPAGRARPAARRARRHHTQPVVDARRALPAARAHRALAPRRQQRAVAS